MSFLKRIFGGGKPRVPARDVAELGKPLRVPAVHVVAKHSGASLSHLGGMPSLPKHFDWPHRNGAKLQFLARLSLPQLQAVQPIDWLPKSGALLFFYDPNQKAWGYDPRHRGWWSVLHVPDLQHPAPGSEAAAGKDALPHRPVEFRRVDVYPSVDRPSVEALGLSDEERDAWCDLPVAIFGDGPMHYVGGFPDPIQSDEMELECQLASNGIYVGDPSGYEHPRAQTLKSGAADWRLLLQFDTDDDLGVTWGDGGRLYFWVQESAARSGNFENAWMVLQST